MTAEKLFNEILVLDSADLIKYVNENRAKIRLLFLENKFSNENIEKFGTIVLALLKKGFTDEEISSQQLQSLFVHLAYFFKNANKPELLESCFSRISNPYFYNRLSAWRKYTKYHTFEEHFTEFESYLALLFTAQNESSDGNPYEILNDLQEYNDYINKFVKGEYLEKLNFLFINEEMIEKYPILKDFADKKAAESPSLRIASYNGVEYEPSDFAIALFKKKFINHIKTNSQPDYPGKLFGINKAEVYRAIKGGQADYDEKYKHLSAEDMVNLYCFFNMRMHFYSSYSFFTRSPLLETFYDNTGGKIKFIDIGCGPATSGLAFIDYLFNKTNEKVVFDYFGIDISQQMLLKATDILNNEAYSEISKINFVNNLEDISNDSFQNATCIIFNCCFVFASDGLPIKRIANYINSLRKEYPFIPMYIMFQNSIYDYLNTKYVEFKALLSKFEVELSEKVKIAYHNEQGSCFSPSYCNVYYELLKL